MPPSNIYPKTVLKFVTVREYLSIYKYNGTDSIYICLHARIQIYSKTFLKFLTVREYISIYKYNATDSIYIRFLLSTI